MSSNRLHFGMIKSFNSKQLQSLWEAGKSKMDARLHSRILRRLDALNEVERPEDMNLLGFKFQSLQGHRPTRHTVHVNGSWCMTFEFENGHAYAVNIEQYH